LASLCVVSHPCRRRRARARRRPDVLVVVVVVVLVLGWESTRSTGLLELDGRGTNVESSRQIVSLVPPEKRTTTTTSTTSTTTRRMTSRSTSTRTNDKDEMGYDLRRRANTSLTLVLLFKDRLERAKFEQLIQHRPLFRITVARNSASLSLFQGEVFNLQLRGLKP